MVDLNKNFHSYNDLLNLAGSVKRIFFYRVCGTGMGSAACLLKERGYDVEGADSNFYPPMSDYLERTNIPCRNLDECDDDFFKAFDLIVVGNVVAKDSKDAKKLESLNVPLCSFPAVLGAFVLSKINHVVGIAGTHGKTTTTYLAKQIAECLGKDAGYFIGGVLENEPSSKIGRDDLFFIESDEYDSAYFEKQSKFHSYSLNHLILTSLEFDHADIFSSVEDIQKEFLKLLPHVDKTVIINSEYEGAEKLLDTKKDCIPYGKNIHIMSVNEKRTKFAIELSGKRFQFETNLIGEHNILNLTSCLIFFHCALGVNGADLQDVVGNLRLVKRRQEERGVYKGSLVVDDFAHHPTAAKLTIDALKKKYPGKKIFVVIEPNSATARSNYFQDEFADALSGADILIVAKPERKTNIKGLEDLNCEEIVHNISLEKKIPAFAVYDLKHLREKIDQHIKEDVVLAILSNGTCLGLWQSDFVDSIQ